MPKARVGGQFDEVGTSAATGIQLCWLSFRPLLGSNQAHPRKVARPDPKNKGTYEQRQLFFPSVHVFIGLLTATEKQVVSGRLHMKNHWHNLTSQTTPQTKVGRTLRRLHCKGCLVETRKPLAHKFSQTKSDSVGTQEDRATVLGPDHFGGHEQHNSCLIHHAFPIAGRYCHAHSGAIVKVDKLSRSKQVIQTEWSLLQVSDHLRTRWRMPQVDLFATRYSHKLPKFVSPVPDPQAWQVDALSINWEELDAYAFPPVSLLCKLVTKILDQGFRRLIPIALGWPNMPWFWDLVNMSAQVPLSLPQVEILLTEPFSQCPHRDLLGLSLRAWLLEPLA